MARNPKRKLLVEWCLNIPNLFAVGGNDLRLYEIESRRKKSRPNGFDIITPSDEPLEDPTETKLIFVNSDIQNIRCLAWAPSTSQYPNLLAAGLGTGRVVLTSLPEDLLLKRQYNEKQRERQETESSQPEQILSKEFLPRHPRACNSISWNPLMPQLLATGLEKAREDFSTLIWDINSSGNEIVTGPIKPSVSAQPQQSSFKTLHLGGNRISCQVSRTVRELNKDAVTVALSWHPTTPLCLATGHSLGHLRLNDLRGSLSASASVQHAHPGDVCGVIFNPYFPEQLATFSTADSTNNSVIKLWDTRKFQTELFIAIETIKITQLSWCPTRTGILAAALHESSGSGSATNSVRIWDVKSSYDILELPDSAKRKERVEIFQEAILSCSKDYTAETIVGTLDPTISWNPVDPHVILVGTSGGSVQLLNIRSPMPMSCSVAGNFAIGFGKDFFEGSPPDLSVTSFSETKKVESGESQHPERDEKSGGNSRNSQPSHRLNKALLEGMGDISYVMLERVKAGYSSDAKKNFEEVVPHFKTEGLYHAWKWIYKMKYKFAKGQTLSEFGGIYKWIHDSKGQDKVYSTSFNFPMFSSTPRALSAKLCGWGFKDYTELDRKLTQCEQEGKFSRAAALAIFHGDIKRALHILQKKSLQKDSGNLYDWVAIALSGYQPPSSTNSSDPSNSSSSSSSVLWKSTCKLLINQISDPYLQAIFIFLCQEIPADTPSHLHAQTSQVSLFYDLLNLKGLDLYDRIGFASRYLKYDDFLKFLGGVMHKVVESGDIKGLIITGLTMIDGGNLWENSGKYGIQLLENYLARTGDVQTIALLFSQVTKRRLSAEPSPIASLFDQTIHIYRELLDRWQLWYERATFDVNRTIVNSIFSESITFSSNSPYISVACKFCNKSFTLGKDPGSRGAGIAHKEYDNQNKQQKIWKSRTTSCPSCSNALPKCAICLLPFEVSTFHTTNVVKDINYYVNVDNGYNYHNSNNANTNNNNNSSQQLTSWASNNGRILEDWFTWCQTCKHGGHVNHLEEWFTKHDVCPVANCDCCCASL